MTWLKYLPLGLLCCAAGPVGAAETLLHNGDFELRDEAGRPVGWETVISAPEVKFTAQVVEEAPASGERCLRIVTDYASQPQVYGCLRVDIPCTPMTEYHFTLRVRAVDNAGGCWFGGGRNWAWINGIPSGSYDWTTLNGWYRTGADETSIPFMLHINGRTTIDFDAITVTRVGAASDPTIRPAYTAWDAAQLQQVFTRHQQETPERRQRLDALAERGVRVDYPLVKLAYLEAFLPIVAKRLPDAEFQLACTVMLDEMNQLAAGFDADLAKLSADAEAFPVVPRYRSGPVEIDGAAMICDVYDPASGMVERRPAILNGFGHFFTVADEMERWSERGCNVVQIEQGPQCMSRAAAGSLQIDPEVADKLVDAFRRAAAADVGIVFLLSPHYLPNEAGGLWSGDEEGPWEYYRAYLGALLPLIREFPSLHSITLSNEPHCFAGPEDVSLQRAWRDYLPRRYADIAALNRAYGTDYADFAAVPMPSAELDRAIVNTPLSPVESLAGRFAREQRSWLYDYVRCKEERFAAWHRRLADLVHEFAPDVPVHAKITAGYYMGHPVADGIDVEQFAEFTEYGGFDEVGGVRVIYDLAPSFRTAPLINTENHLLQPDYNFDQIDHERVYCDLFAQAMHGQAVSATWVYEPYYDPLATNTYSMRPAGMAAVSRAGMDLMRVAPELAALQEEPRRVAVLYAPMSWWYQDRTHPVWRSSWAAFYDSGLRIGFRSERQLQNDDFGATEVLIVPEAEVLEPATVAALRRFTARGGQVIGVGTLPAFGPGWEPLDPETVAGLCTVELPLELGWEAKLVAAVRAAGVRPEVELTSPEGETVAGVHYLSGTCDGKTVVAAINTSGRRVTLMPRRTAPGAAAVTTVWDAVRDRAAELPLVLESYEAAVWRLD